MSSSKTARPTPRMRTPQLHRSAIAHEGNVMSVITKVYGDRVEIMSKTTINMLKLSSIAAVIALSAASPASARALDLRRENGEVSSVIRGLAGA